MKRLLYILSIILIGVGCKKIDPFIETDEGSNVLGFYLNGEKVSNETTVLLPSLHIDNRVYTRHLNADSLEITASLDNYLFYGISIKVAIADISTQQDLTDPDIDLFYIFRVSPITPDHIIDGGGHFERYRTEPVGGKLSFRTWDQNAGILSGNFSFDCDAPQFDGSVKRISVTKGNFDVNINHDGNSL